MKLLLLQNIDKINPEKIEGYINFGGYKTLKKVLTLKPQKIIEIILNSGLRGRSGCGFPTGKKWQLVGFNPEGEKYLICNAHEGEPATFKDKFLLEKNPHLVIEGMIIAAYATGIQKGYIYLNEHYKSASARLEKALKESHKNNFLGKNILKNKFNFEISIVKSLPYYVCGEESVVVETILGNRPEPRIKPPFVGSVGLHNKPTLVNNVETLANVPIILEKGTKEFKKIGTKNSPGTKLITLGGDIKYPGVFEIEMGTKLTNIIYELGGGIKEGKRLKFVQTGGGAAGTVVPPQLLDTALDFDACQKGVALGPGTIVVFDQDTKIIDFLKGIVRFFARESCGKCTPCREGTNRLVKLIEAKGQKTKESTYVTSDMTSADRLKNIDLILEVCDNLSRSAFCGLGQAAPAPITTVLKWFKNELKESL